MRHPSIRFLALLTAFGTMLVVLRTSFTHTFDFYFLLWNLLLAAIPFWISILLLKKNWTKKYPILFYPIAAIWLLFLPNAPYIVTDLLHLQYSKEHWIWYDTLLILSFALAGMGLGLIAVKNMAQIVLEKWNSVVAVVVVSLSFFASGFGVYLGRYHRYNSWDLLNNPIALAQDIIARFIHPAAHLRTWGMTIFIGLFMHILYYGFMKSTPNKRVLKRNAAQ